MIERINFEKEFGFQRDVFDLAAAAEAEKNNLLQTRLQSNQDVGIPKLK